MSLDLYTTVNYLAFLISAAGLILPALIIYFYARFKNHLALVISMALLLLSAIAVKDRIIILLPFILPVLFSGFMGSLIKKYGSDLWSSVGYVILAEMTGIIIGIVVIYFYYGMQDIAELLGEGFRTAYLNVRPGSVEETSLNYITMFYSMPETSSFGALLEQLNSRMAEISALSNAEKLNIIVPIYKIIVASALPSVIMSYGIISGTWAWILSSVMIRKRAVDKKPLPGIVEYKPQLPFSEWKLPRWLTNVLLVLLLVSLIISVAAKGAMLNAAAALQTVAVVILSIQGLAVVNWWLKKKRVHVILNATICAVAVLASLVLTFLLPFIGLIDIMFSVRMSQQQKEAIRKRMEDIQKQVDEQMKELHDKKKEEEENKQDEKENENEENSDGQDESEDK